MQMSTCLGDSKHAYYHFTDEKTKSGQAKQAVPV